MKYAQGTIKQLWSYQAIWNSEKQKNILIQVRMDIVML